MPIIPILQYPDLRLSKKARKVENVKEPAIQKIIDDMLETLRNTENCAALAAVQLDLPDPPSITVIKSEDPAKENLVLVNPEILAASGEHSEKEGCMSVYPNHVHASVCRAKQVKVRALDRNGNVLEINADGFLAKCLQHEIDHLNGIVYLDKLSGLKRSLLERKIEKVKNIS